jgi:hypothetical protein
MTDTKISAMPLATLPLTTEAVPCVQDGENVQAPAAAFGIPIASVDAPAPLSDYQTWINLDTSPPTLCVAIGGSWVTLYTIDGTGALTFTQPLTLAADPTTTLQAATKHYVDNSLPTSTFVYKGLLNCSGNPDYPGSSKVGHYYLVSAAGKVGGVSGAGVGVGDGILCIVDNAGGNQATVGTSWTIVQGHDTAVTGPASAVDSRFVLFSGTTGKVVKDGNLTLSTDATMASNSDALVPSQKAVKAQIGGQPLSADTLSQGYGWFWDAVTSTFKVRANEGQNLLANSAFEIWQEATSFTLPNVGPKTHVADFWKAASPAPGRTVSRVSGTSGTQYALKVSRTAGNTNTNKIILGQQFGQLESAYLAGKTVTVSFDFSVGSTYTPTTLFVALGWGTGIDEDIDLHVSAPAFATGGGGAITASLASQIAASPTVSRIIAPPLTFAAGITESIFIIQTGSFVGTAGGDDSFTIANIKMEIGNIATPYRKPQAMDELVRAQRRYWKTFLQGTAPSLTTAAGAATGEHRAAATKAGASAQSLGTIRFPTMRAVPTVSLFSPVTNAGTQARDFTASADCTSTTAQNVSDCSVEVITTGNASTAVGNTLGVHVVADARL